MKNEKVENIIAVMIGLAIAFSAGAVVQTYKEYYQSTINIPEQTESTK
jgi:hypothetical protein